MALPVSSSTKIFDRDQTPYFQLDYWNTTMTYPSAGVEYAVFDLLDLTFAATGKSTIEGFLTRENTPASRKLSSVFGYASASQGAAYNTGVVPSMYGYWGAGAPLGAKNAKQCLVKWSGYVKTAGTVTFAFAGNGKLRAYRTRSGVTTTLVEGTLHEPTDDINVNSTTPADLGYLTATNTVAVGDQIEIYYIHSGEAWGGLCVKAIPGTASSTLLTFLDQLRDAPVVSASFIGKESSGANLASSVIPYVDHAELNVEKGGIPTLDVHVPLSSSDYTQGFIVSKDSGGGTFLTDRAAGAMTIKAGRRIKLRAGYAHATSFTGGTGAGGNIEEYPRFTGYIEDIVVDPKEAMATLKCRNFSGCLEETFDEGYPHRLSYLSNGYVWREFVGDPVWPIPAFDAWPLETAIAELCYQAGVDAYQLGKLPTDTTANFGRRQFILNQQQTTYYGASLFQCRTLSDNTKKVYIERQSNYGNVGLLFKDYLPKDDEYLFKSEVTERLLDRAHKLANHYGYDFQFNADGQASIIARNNPVSFTYASTLAAADERVNPAAVGGRYLYKRHSVNGAAQVLQTTAFCSRMDLYVGVGPDALTAFNGGKLSILVEYRNISNGWTAQSGYPVVKSTYYNSETDYFAYDNVVDAAGNNVAIFTLFDLPFNEYRVTITLNGPDTTAQPGATDASFRLNGLAVFERDPLANAFTQTITTLGNALQLDPESERKELRNHVIVVGSRKTATTDSAKFDTENNDNPNNPASEFYVDVAADVGSIYLNTSTNFVGKKKTAMVFDDKIVDSDFARWLSRTLLLRQRQPKDSARLNHTAIPALEILDCIKVKEERYGTVDHTLWVEKFTETWDAAGEATTSVDLTSFPEIPSYQPREDVDIDTLYDHDGDGKGEPVINLRLSYKNVYTTALVNADLSAPAMLESKALGSSAPMTSEACTAGPQTTTNKPIPETLYIYGKDSGNAAKQRILVNNPYRFFYKTDWLTTPQKMRLTYDFQEGDGSSQYNTTYYNFPSGNGWQYYLNYDYFQTRTGNNPFYDPYSSEVGNLVSITFDALISGRYRVSLWQADKSQQLVSRVAWLTRSGEEGADENKHWQYLEAGENKQFFWDGVDNIGEWNELQSEKLSEIIEGAFNDNTTRVGSGFYAWNDRTTNLHTQIGDAIANNYGTNGEPYYTLGQYGKFMVVVECMNDTIMRKKGEVDPRRVLSNNLPYTYTAGPSIGSPTGWHNVAQVYVWTHLADPNQVSIQCYDWIGTGNWTPGRVTTGADWTLTPLTNAAFKDGTPIRVKFTPLARRGKLFETAGSAATNVKLSRLVKLKATFFDQFWTFFGTSWQNIDYRNPAGYEKKRLTNRMFHNEDHALEYQDDDYRSGTDLAAYEWIFQPDQFKKDFGTGRTEKLKYGDYEQLEALPGHSSRRGGGSAKTDRAYLNMAFINYLFYVSAYTIDRSGRRQWCLDRSFIDKSKIVSSTWLGATAGSKPEYTSNYVRGADRYLARSIFVRQWVEPTWTSTYPGNPKVAHTITDAHQTAFLQPLITSFGFESDNFNHPTSSLTALDYNLKAYATNSTVVNQTIIRGKGSEFKTNATLSLSSTNKFYRRITGFGTWNFNRENYSNYYYPSPTMDFHPYWRYPYMPDWSTWKWHQYTQTDATNVSGSPDYRGNYQNVLEMPASAYRAAMRDGAEQENWFGYMRRDQFASDYAGTLAAFPTATPTSFQLQYYGIRLEESAEGELKDSVAASSTEMAAMFDYVKQDQLDRFDQFRGLWSRGKFTSREREDATYWEDKRDRVASTRGLKPAGSYLLNLANYDRYFVAPQHSGTRAHVYTKMHGGFFVDTQELPVHFVNQITNWFDIRFRSSYVWYNDQWFPIDGNGASCYGYFQNEFTKAREYIGGFWWESGDIGTPVYYDAGAWTGWKDDVASGNWTADPKLRWNENSAISPTNTFYDVNSATDKWRYGGDAQSGATAFMGKTNNYAAANIHDEYTHGWWRLAVGPKVPETNSLVMNLVLPANLKV